MGQRPTTVTVIAWLLIVMAGLTLLSSALTLNNPMARDIMGRSPIPIPVQFAMALAGVVVMLISGVFLWRGKAWARLLYVAWNAVGLVVGFATSPMKTAMIPGLLVFLLITFFLYRPSASAFLAQTDSTDAGKSL